jgi:hypothetical protein
MHGMYVKKTPQTVQKLVVAAELINQHPFFLLKDI